MNSVVYLAKSERNFPFIAHALCYKQCAQRFHFIILTSDSVLQTVFFKCRHANKMNKQL